MIKGYLKSPQAPQLPRSQPLAVPLGQRSLNPSYIPHWALAASVLLAIGLALTGLGQPAFLLAWIAASALLPASLGALSRAFFGAILVATLMVVLATLFALARAALLPTTLAALCAGCLGGAALLFGDLRFRSRPGDALLGTIIIAVHLPYLPMLRGSAVDFVSHLSAGHDNVTHVRIAWAIAETGGFLSREAPVPGLYDTPPVYTQGQAFLSAYLPWIMRGGNSAVSVDQILQGAVVFYLIQVVGLTVACLLLAREIHQTLSTTPFKATAKRAAAPLAAVYAAIAVFSALGVGAVLHQFGFQSQLFATVCAMAGLTYLVRPAFAYERIWPALIGSCSAVLVCHSWPLVLPAVGLPLALFLARNMRRVPLSTYGLIVGLALIGLYPMLGRSRSLPDPSFLAGSSNGAIVTIPAVVWLPTIIVATAALLYIRRSNSELRISPIYSGLIGAIAAVVAIGVMQVQSGAGVNYYFYKTLYLALTIGACIVLAAIPTVAATTGRFFVALMSAVVFLGWMPLAGWSAMHLLGQDPILVERTVVERALRESRVAPTQRHDMIVLQHCYTDRVDYTTEWLGTLLRTWGPERNELFYNLQSDNSVERMKKYAATKSVDIVHVYGTVECRALIDMQRAIIPQVEISVLE